MKKIFILSLSIIILTFINSFSQVIDVLEDQDNPNEDKTLSPYFLVKSDNPDVDRMPLLSTSADVTIAGVIADVTVKQVYKNFGKKPLEAIYVFPASTKAAVYGMTMTIGDRILKAEIKEKQEARAIYNKAKKEGKSTSLLEQSRPNVFTMNVANIMPGDSILVELKYTELLIPDNKEYRFIYPTVVGPRYSEVKKDSAKESDKFIETPYQHQGEKPTYSFNIKINLTTAVPLQDIKCTSHKVNIERISDYKTLIELDNSEDFSANKDFILQYSLNGNKIETGLLLSGNDKEKYFLLMLQPPQRVNITEIPPREYIFIIDVSGSMRGFPLDVSKKLMNEIFQYLRPIDNFNILFFAGYSQMLFPESRPANAMNINSAEKMFDSMSGGGGTRLMPALQKALKLPKVENASRSFVIITDGYIGVEKETFDLIRNNLNNANVFAFGIGSSVNRFLIKGIARAGMGQPFFVTNNKEAEPVSQKFVNYIKSPIMTNIKVNFNSFLANSVEPQSIPDVFADRPIIVYGKWDGTPDGYINVSGLINGRQYNVDINVLQFGRKVEGDALKYLWARNKIAQISDYSSFEEERNNKDEITNLGLNYNLLTKYTSFVAVDYIRRNGKDSIVSVKQALPLPEGVSDFAVGGSSRVLMRSSGMGANPLAPEFRSESYEKFTLPTKPKVEKRYPGINDFVPVEQPPFVDLNLIKKNTVYPEIPCKSGIEGKVIVRGLVDRFGKVIKTHIEYSDSPMLDSAAINAMVKTQFTPAMLNKKPVPCWVTVPINFTISDIENFEIKDLKIGKGVLIKSGNKISFNYIFSSSCDKSEIFNSYKSGKPFMYRYGKDKKYSLLDSCFDKMRVGGKREIIIPNKFNNKIKKIFNLETKEKYLKIEIELMNAR